MLKTQRFLGSATALVDASQFSQIGSGLISNTSRLWPFMCCDTCCFQMFVTTCWTRKTTPYLFHITHTFQTWKRSDFIHSRTEWRMTPVHVPHKPICSWNQSSVKAFVTVCVYLEEKKLNLCGCFYICTMFIWFDSLCSPKTNYTLQGGSNSQCLHAVLCEDF